MLTKLLLVAATMTALVASAAETPGRSSRILFGVSPPQENVSWADLRTAWQEAEALGFDSAWVYDHPANPSFEAWTVLSALATQTQKLRIGVLVTGNTYRNPALLAKMTSTVDQISNGRVILGIGAAWSETDHRAYGFPFYTAQERANRLGEALEVITKLFTQDHPSFKGKYYSLADAPFAPVPVQRPHPPIMVGGQGRKWIMPLVARYADGWNVPPAITPSGIKRRLEIIRQECQRIGRTPCDLEISVGLALTSISHAAPGTAAPTPTRAATEKKFKVMQHSLSGTPDEIKAQIRRSTVTSCARLRRK